MGTDWRDNHPRAEPIVHVYSVAPNAAAVEFRWTDFDPRPGVSWYYVRVLQSDGQVAWASPIWVRIPMAR